MTAFRVSTLKAVTALCLLTADIKHAVNQLGALGVVTLGPVVAGACLSEDKVVLGSRASGLG